MPKVDGIILGGNPAVRRKNVPILSPSTFHDSIEMLRQYNVLTHTDETSKVISMLNIASEISSIPSINGIRMIQKNTPPGSRMLLPKMTTLYGNNGFVQRRENDRLMMFTEVSSLLCRNPECPRGTRIDMSGKQWKDVQATALKIDNVIHRVQAFHLNVDRTESNNDKKKKKKKLISISDLRCNVCKSIDIWKLKIEVSRNSIRSKIEMVIVHGDPETTRDVSDLKVNVLQNLSNHFLRNILSMECKGWGNLGFRSDIDPVAASHYNIMVGPAMGAPVQNVPKMFVFHFDVENKPSPGEVLEDIVRSLAFPMTRSSNVVGQDKQHIHLVREMNRRVTMSILSKTKKKKQPKGLHAHEETLEDNTKSARIDPLLRRMLMSYGASGMIAGVQTILPLYMHDGNIQDLPRTVAIARSDVVGLRNGDKPLVFEVQFPACEIQHWDIDKHEAAELYLYKVYADGIELFTDTKRLVNGGLAIWRNQHLRRILYADLRSNVTGNITAVFYKPNGSFLTYSREPMLTAASVVQLRIRNDVDMKDIPLEGESIGTVPLNFTCTTIGVGIYPLDRKNGDFDGDRMDLKHIPMFQALMLLRGAYHDVDICTGSNEATIDSTFAPLANITMGMPESQQGLDALIKLSKKQISNLFSDDEFSTDCYVVPVHGVDGQLISLEKTNGQTDYFTLGSIEETNAKWEYNDYSHPIMNRVSVPGPGHGETWSKNSVYHLSFPFSSSRRIDHEECLDIYGCRVETEDLLMKNRVSSSSSTRYQQVGFQYGSDGGDNLQSSSSSSSSSTRHQQIGFQYDSDGGDDLQAPSDDNDNLPQKVKTWYSGQAKSGQYKDITNPGLDDIEMQKIIIKRCVGTCRQQPGAKYRLYPGALAIAKVFMDAGLRVLHRHTHPMKVNGLYTQRQIFKWKPFANFDNQMNGFVKDLSSWHQGVWTSAKSKQVNSTLGVGASVFKKHIEDIPEIQVDLDAHEITIFYQTFEWDPAKDFISDVDKVAQNWPRSCREFWEKEVMNGREYTKTRIIRMQEAGQIQVDFVSHKITPKKTFTLDSSQDFNSQMKTFVQKWPSSSKKFWQMAQILYAKETEASGDFQNLVNRMNMGEKIQVDLDTQTITTLGETFEWDPEEDFDSEMEKIVQSWSSSLKEFWAKTKVDDWGGSEFKDLVADKQMEHKIQVDLDTQEITIFQDPLPLEGQIDEWVVDVLGYRKQKEKQFLGLEMMECAWRAAKLSFHSTGEEEEKERVMDMKWLQKYLSSNRLALPVVLFPLTLEEITNALDRVRALHRSQLQHLWLYQRLHSMARVSHTQVLQPQLPADEWRGHPRLAGVAEFRMRWIRQYVLEKCRESPRMCNYYMSKARKWLGSAGFWLPSDNGKVGKIPIQMAIGIIHKVRNQNAIDVDGGQDVSRSESQRSHPIISVVTTDDPTYYLKLIEGARPPQGKHVGGKDVETIGASAQEARVRAMDHVVTRFGLSLYGYSEAPQVTSVSLLDDSDDDLSDSDEEEEEELIDDGVDALQNLAESPNSRRVILSPFGSSFHIVHACADSSRYPANANNDGWEESVRQDTQHLFSQDVWDKNILLCGCRARFMSGLENITWPTVHDNHIPIFDENASPMIFMRKELNVYTENPGTVDIQPVQWLQQIRNNGNNDRYLKFTPPFKLQGILSGASVVHYFTGYLPVESINRILSELLPARPEQILMYEGEQTLQDCVVFKYLGESFNCLEGVMERALQWSTDLVKHFINAAKQEVIGKICFAHMPKKTLPLVESLQINQPAADGGDWSSFGLFHDLINKVESFHSGKFQAQNFQEGDLFKSCKIEADGHCSTHDPVRLDWQNRITTYEDCLELGDVCTRCYSWDKYQQDGGNKATNEETLKGVVTRKELNYNQQVNSLKWFDTLLFWIRATPQVLHLPPTDFNRWLIRGIQKLQHQYQSMRPFETAEIIERAQHRARMQRSLDLMKKVFDRGLSTIADMERKLLYPITTRASIDRVHVWSPSKCIQLPSPKDARDLHKILDKLWSDPTYSRDMYAIEGEDMPRRAKISVVSPVRTDQILNQNDLKQSVRYIKFQRIVGYDDNDEEKVLWDSDKHIKWLSNSYDVEPMQGQIHPQAEGKFDDDDELFKIKYTMEMKKIRQDQPTEEEEDKKDEEEEKKTVWEGELHSPVITCSKSHNVLSWNIRSRLMIYVSITETDPVSGEYFMIVVRSVVQSKHKDQMVKWNYEYFSDSQKKGEVEEIIQNALDLTFRWITDDVHAPVQAESLVPHITKKQANEEAEFDYVAIPNVGSIHGTIEDNNYTVQVPCNMSIEKVIGIGQKYINHTGFVMTPWLIETTMDIFGIHAAILTRTCMSTNRIFGGQSLLASIEACMYMLQMDQTEDRQENALSNFADLAEGQNMEKFERKQKERILFKPTIVNVKTPIGEKILGRKSIQHIAAGEEIQDIMKMLEKKENVIFG